MTVSQLRQGPVVQVSPDCTAPNHGSRYAFADHRCDCPSARRRRRRSCERRRSYVPGRQVNLAGSRTWFDEIAVERAVGGDRSLILSVPERSAAIDQLDKLGKSATEIAIRLGCTQRTVQRRRAKRRAEQEAAQAAEQEAAHAAAAA